LGQGSRESAFHHQPDPAAALQVQASPPRLIAQTLSPRGRGGMTMHRQPVRPLCRPAPHPGSVVRFVIGKRRATSINHGVDPYQDC
jgi:hypothetical protein